MSLSMDLKIRGQYGRTPVIPGGGSPASGDGSFSQVLSAALQSGGAVNYETCFQAAAETYQVPVGLLKAVAKVESDFTADAVSCCGAQGVMQLMPATARYLGVTDAFDPAQNIMGGAKYLRQLLDRFNGDVSKALAGYNAGPGAVEKCGGVPSYARGYVNKVLGYMGGGVSVPTQAFSAGTAAGAIPSGADGGAAPSLDSLDTLSKGELADLLLREYQSGGIRSKEAARLFLQKLLAPEEDKEPYRPGTDSQPDLKDLVLQASL